MQTIIDRRGKYTNNIRKYNTFIELFQLFLTFSDIKTANT